MRQRLGLAAALVSRPRLLVLDEPANGLDPAGSRHVHRVIADLAADGVAVVLSSHRMDDVAALCADVTLLAGGRVVFSGPPAKLAAEGGDAEHRVVTSDRQRAADVADTVPGLHVLPGPAPTCPAPAATDDALVVRGRVEAVEALVERLVGAGVALRELTPVVSPLEAAFLALTAGGAEAGR